jgi:hypothetical protein
MPNLGSIAERMVVRTTLPGGFRDRLAATILATILNFTVIATYAPAAYQCTRSVWFVPVLFSCFAFGMFVVLSHMWVITLQSWKH